MKAWYRRACQMRARTLSDLWSILHQSDNIFTKKNGAANILCFSFNCICFAASCRRRRPRTVRARVHEFYLRAFHIYIRSLLHTYYFALDMEDAVQWTCVRAPNIYAIYAHLWIHWKITSGHGHQKWPGVYAFIHLFICLFVRLFMLHICELWWLIFWFGNGFLLALW